MPWLKKIRRLFRLYKELWGSQYRKKSQLTELLSIMVFKILYFGAKIMKPSLLLDHNRISIRELADRFHTKNPRVFGSVLYGTDKEGSDLDLLVDVLPGTTLLDLGGLQVELEMLLGIHIDLLTPDDLPSKFRDKVLSEARPI